MELAFAVVIGALTASGVYLMLRARTFPVVVGLALTCSCSRPDGWRPVASPSSAARKPIPIPCPRHWC